LRIELAQLTPVRTAYEEIRSHQDNIAQINEMMKDTKDDSEKKLLQEEIQASTDKLA
jgi:protein subunit release factor A